jgi:hypothetical protein
MFNVLRLQVQSAWNQLENGYLLVETCGYSTDKAHNIIVTVYVNIEAQ